YNADGRRSQITAVNSSTGNQTTEYVYGTTLDDSEIARSDLLRAEVYPDSSDPSDRITFTYNRQKQKTEVTDQQGTVHAFDYDNLGRQIQDRVTALGMGVDDAARRIATSYEVRGLRAKATTYDNPTVGSGDVVNEVELGYNDLVATSAARYRALRSLPKVTRNCRCHDDEDKEAGSRVKH
ncbi:MAG TPA: hypothetical protein VM141_13620, partial [Planctomycetota bacterium]|nr:hypothetical protein [Planctomycetota bacterium]